MARPATRKARRRSTRWCSRPLWPCRQRDVFKPRWQIEQETTCAGLDLDVDFYTDVSDVSDLNKDGVAEVTVASHAFCGGGIDPHDIAIEMREGQACTALPASR
jgi:hypothetical protein